ncbi:MAG: MBL fold metallo-hydrolase [Candidatus Dormiibacterota bacterium]
MEITWLGASALLLKGRDTRVLVDPAYQPGKASSNGSFEIVVSSAAGENRLRPEQGPQVVARQGEYELRGVSVRGVATGTGTVFVTEVDEVAICDFGELPGVLEVEVLDALGTIDVLAVSVQEGSAQRARELTNLVSQLQPAVLIPVGYHASGDGSLGELASFAQEMGLAQVNPQPKLTLSGSPGISDETRVVVLEARH